MTAPAPFFSCVNARLALSRRASEIVGTPFAHNSRAFDRRGGCDCWAAVNEIHRAAGALPIVPLPRYSLRWPPERFAAIIDQVFAASSTPEAHWLPAPETLADPQRLLRLGDVVLILAKGPPHCAAILAGGAYLHATPDRGVAIDPLATRDQLSSLAAVYRAYRQP